MKPYSEACERNREPSSPSSSASSGTRGGARDRIGHGPARRVLRRGAAAPEVAGERCRRAICRHPPVVAGAWRRIELDIDGRLAGDRRRRGVFSANTAHIMSWPQVERMFAGVASMGSCACSLSTGRSSTVDERRRRATHASMPCCVAGSPASGVRDFEHIQALAGRCGLAVIEDNAMPANNRLLVFRKEN